MNDARQPQKNESGPGESSRALIRIAQTDDQEVDCTRRRIRRLPPEVGAVLIGAGVVGILLPGPIGTPLLLAGGLVLVPRAFDRIDGWMQRRFPRSYRAGMKYVDRFLDDFERRYPPDEAV